MIGSVTQGTTKSFPFQVFQADLVTPSAAYLASDTLTSVLSPGDDRPALTTPTAAWIDATVASWSLNLVPADTAAATVPPGVYRIRVIATRGSAIAELLRDSIEVLPTEGTGTAPAVYGSYNDMQAECNWIGQFADGADQSGFAEQRGKARLWLDDLILRAAPVGGQGALISRQSWWSWSYSGLDPRSGTGLAIDTTLAAYLASNCLMTTGPRGQGIITATSCYAIALVLRAQPGNDNLKLASYFMRRAQAEASMLVCEIDINGSGKPAYAIALGVTNTRYA
jgi:hypothetical protein